MAIRSKPTPAATSAWIRRAISTHSRPSPAAEKKLKLVDTVLGATGFGAGEGTVGGISAGKGVYENIMSMLRTVTDEPVRFVINTHYHGDHAGGNAKLQALDALVVASDQARARMVIANQSGLPNVTVGDSAVLHVGGKTVELYRVPPAHTNGDVVVLFPDYRVLATGDIFANGPGTSAQLVDSAGGGSAMQWPQAVEKALELDFDTVVPGHGLISTRADLEAYHDRTQRFSAVLSDLVQQGKTRDEIEAVVRADFDWEDFHVQMALDGLINEYR